MLKNPKADENQFLDFLFYSKHKFSLNTHAAKKKNGFRVNWNPFFFLILFNLVFFGLAFEPLLHHTFILIGVQ